MQGKYYPLKLCRWESFHERHHQIVDQFAQTFSDKRPFPSKIEVRTVKRELSSVTRKDEQDIRPFARSAIEKPAERIVNAYLGLTGDPTRFLSRTTPTACRDLRWSSTPTQQKKVRRPLTTSTRSLGAPSRPRGKALSHICWRIQGCI